MVAGDHSKTLRFLEDCYRRFKSRCNLEHENAFAIELSPESSLEIRLPARATEDRQETVALWRRPEKEETGLGFVSKSVVMRSCEPLG